MDMLELMKQQSVTAQQSHLFGTITIVWRNERRGEEDERE